MSTPETKQFRDLPDPVSTFERLFRAALESLLPDLADAPWFVREHEVVNLFVFRHLIPRFQAEEFDISQIGIEVPVQKIRETSKQKFGRNGDIVVWPHPKATIWRTCKPLALIEWKNISCRERNPRNLQQDHRDDISFLDFNSSLISVGYAVLTDQRHGHVQMFCKRIVYGRPITDFSSPPLRCAATCPDDAISQLQGDYVELRSRAQNCPDCIPQPSGAFRAPGKVSLQ